MIITFASVNGKTELPSSSVSYLKSDIVLSGVIIPRGRRNIEESRFGGENEVLINSAVDVIFFPFTSFTDVY